MKVSEYFGSSKWHFYLGATLPLTLNGALPFFLRRLTTKQVWTDRSKVYVLATAFAFSCLSLAGHKERRFILPLMPMMIAIAAMGMNKCANCWSTFLNTYVLVNLFGLILFVRVFNTGPADVIEFLAVEAQRGKATQIFLLLPCVLTPFYSQFHYNVPMTFPQCPPPLKKTDEEPDEIDAFLANPEPWMRKWFGQDLKDNTSHLAMLDTFSNMPTIQRYLAINGMKVCKVINISFFDDGYEAYLPQQFYVSYDVTIYCRNKK